MNLEIFKLYREDAHTPRKLAIQMPTRIAYLLEFDISKGPSFFLGSTVTGAPTPAAFGRSISASKGSRSEGVCMTELWKGCRNVGSESYKGPTTPRCRTCRNKLCDRLTNSLNFQNNSFQGHVVNLWSVVHLRPRDYRFVADHLSLR